MEGLQWEANAQADRGDVWPDEHFQATAGLDDLAALGITVKRAD